MIKFFLTTLLLSVSSYAYSIHINGCSDKINDVIKRDHDRAANRLKMTINLLNKPIISQNELVIKGLERYFKIYIRKDLATSMDMLNFRIIQNNLKLMHNNLHELSYYCPNFSFLTCKKGGYMSTAYANKLIKVCGPWFKLKNTYRRSIIVHEWAHQYIKNIYAGYNDTYCNENYKFESSDLVRLADQYMGFVFYISSNGRLGNCNF